MMRKQKRKHIMHETDAGTYRCTVSDGRDDSALKDVTLIVTADNKERK